MRYFKESEWREEVKDLKNEMRSDSSKSPESTPWWAIRAATTRGAALYFYFSLPADFNTNADHIIRLRKELKWTRNERRAQWRKSLKAKISRWLLKQEYKRITKHDQTK